MKKAFRVSLFILLIILESCAVRTDLIPDNSKDLVYFKFFLFLKNSSHDLNGSGDAVIRRDKIIKLKVYDNFLNRHIFDFISDASGRNSVIVPDDRVVYEKYDNAFPVLMTHYIYAFMALDKIDRAADPGIKEMIMEGPYIKQIIFTYFMRNIKIEIEKRFEDGRPERIKCEMDGDTLIFDITEYGNYDFMIDKAGFREIRDGSARSLFEWLGDFYGQG
ncbi:MAG: hypothetical protein ABSG94_08640 [Brevinematales bacterium]|jgi:hypothetical protein